MYLYIIGNLFYDHLFLQISACLNYITTLHPWIYLVHGEVAPSLPTSPGKILGIGMLIMFSSCYRGFHGGTPKSSIFEGSFHSELPSYGGTTMSGTLRKYRGYTHPWSTSLRELRGAKHDLGWPSWSHKSTWVNCNHTTEHSEIIYSPEKIEHLMLSYVYIYIYAHRAHTWSINIPGAKPWFIVGSSNPLVVSILRRLRDCVAVHVEKASERGSSGLLGKALFGGHQLHRWLDPFQVGECLLMLVSHIYLYHFISFI